MSAKVSAVIPAYNAEETIAAAVESLLAQSLRPYEIIVVDDGSTDGTREVLASFGNRVRVIHQPNRGLAGARTTGHEAARGDYVAWLDADDRALPQRLAVQVAVLESEPSIVLVCSDFNAIGANGATERYAARYYGAIRAPGSLQRIFGEPNCIAVEGRTWHYHSGDVRAALILGNFIHPPTALIRASAVDRAGPLDDAFPTSEDWLYFVSVARHGGVAFIVEPLLEYRLSPHQMSRAASLVAVNNLRSLEHVISQEPELARQEAPRVRAALAARHRAVAAVLSESERLSAARHLWTAFRLGGASAADVRTLVKVVLPARILRALRRMRRRSRPSEA